MLTAKQKVQKIISEMVKKELSMINEESNIFYVWVNDTRQEIDGDSLYDAKVKAIAKYKVPKSKQGTMAIMSKKAYDNQEFRYN